MLKQILGGWLAFACGILCVYPSGILAAEASTQSAPKQLSAQAELDRMAGTFTGLVTAVAGQVDVRKVNLSEWVPLTLNAVLEQGDELRSGPDGSVRVEFSNGNVVSIKANSTLIISELGLDLKSGKPKSVFDVIKASLKAEVNSKQKQQFEIKTPMTTIGVRGTILYVNARPDFTEVFVERGRVELRDGSRGETRQLNAGFAVTADSGGDVSDPFVPPPEKMQQFQSDWEVDVLPPPPPDANGDGVPDLPPDKNGDGFPDPPPDLNGDGIPDQPPPPDAVKFLGVPGPLDIYQQQQNFYQQQQNAIMGNQLEQQAYLPGYTTGSLPGDNDFDGIPDNIDSDDDNDFLIDSDEINVFHTAVLKQDTDGDGLTDWEEARVQKTSPLQVHSDSDGVPDIADVFPLNPALTGNRADIRVKRYAQVQSIPGLRSEIAGMLTDNNERTKDFLMDRISDAQTHKVLKNHSGNWVRTEEYVFRPKPNEVDVQVITYDSSAGGWTSMLWSTSFNSSLSGLSSPQIRDLPWDIYLSSIPNYGATAPALFPTNMKVLFEHQGTTDSFVNSRAYANPAFGSQWTQNVVNTASVNGGSFLTYSVNAGTPNTNPYNFSYPSVGATFDIYVINDNGTLQGTHTFNDLFSVLGANLPGFTAVGNNNIEIKLSFSSNVWTVIYVPIRSLIWRGTPDWYQPLSW